MARKTRVTKIALTPVNVDMPEEERVRRFTRATELLLVWKARKEERESKLRQENENESKVADADTENGATD
jgi:hypothetical protein